MEIIFDIRKVWAFYNIDNFYFTNYQTNIIYHCYSNIFQTPYLKIFK